MNTTIDEAILAKAQLWLTENFDEETKKEVKNLIDNDPTGLTDAFYQDLEFGTGGLRGIMGAGSNRMNKYTVGMATQGFANYLKKIYSNLPQIKAVIAYDSRNNSSYFSQISADVLSANGIKVFLFDALRPTPELSFSVRYLKCQGGIVVTASHNPKEYNGYKVYGDDGGQLVNPYDKDVINEVKKIKSVADVKFNPNKNLIEYIGETVDNAYIEKVKALSLSEELVKKHSDLKIVYTPLHGSGVKLVPWALKEFGFKNIVSVEEQNISDGNFPTIKSPNPEESAALDMAIKKAQASNADLVMATDPDADRVGIAVKDNSGKFILLNGNQTSVLLVYYVLSKWKENGKITGKEFIVSTIVTTGILKEIAEKNNVESKEVLTGFKYIAEIIKKNEGEKTFIVGGEESYGYLTGDFVRDKDAVSSCCMIAEAAVWAKNKGKTLYDLLIDVYTEFGVYKEHLVNIVKKGKSGADQIKKMMLDYRENPLKEISKITVVKILDYQLQIEKDMLNNQTKSYDHLPKSDVIQFFLKDGSKITVRPSGTEPKIKFYFSVKENITDRKDFAKTIEKLDEKINEIIFSMGLNN